MKYKKSYYALIGPGQWKLSHSEMVDIDPAEAAKQNEMFKQTGVQYCKIVTESDGSRTVIPAGFTRPLDDQEHILTELDMEDNPDLAERGLKVGDLVAFPVINRNTKPKGPIEDEPAEATTPSVAEKTAKIKAAMDQEFDRVTLKDNGPLEDLKPAEKPGTETTKAAEHVAPKEPVSDTPEAPSEPSAETGVAPEEPTAEKPA